MFFSFDGIDGVGKSTQINRFREWLTTRGLTVCECRDPGSTPLGERVRDILLHSSDDLPISARSEMLLYMTARAQLVEEVIRPAMARGDVILSDRYLLANVVYQGHAGGLSPALVKQVGAATVDGVYPDCTFLLDMPPAEAARRLQGPRDRMERRGDEYRERLREGFLVEAAVDDRVHVVDSTQSIEQVSEAVQRIAEPLLASL